MAWNLAGDLGIIGGHGKFAYVRVDIVNKNITSSGTVVTSSNIATKGIAFINNNTFFFSYGVADYIV